MRATLQYRRHIAFALVALALFGWWMSSRDPAIEQPGPAQQLSASAVAPSSFPESTSTIPSRPVSSGAATETGLLGTLHGRVVDAATQMPVREFRLELQRAPSIAGRATPPGKNFRTVDGRFEWSGVQADRWRLVASATGYQRFELDNVTVAAQRATPDLLILLRPGAALTGRVYDQATGRGIANAQIEFRETHVPRSATDARGRQAAKTDARGNFRFDGLPDGRVTLTVTAGDFAVREMEVVTGTASSVDIPMSAGATIAGLLTASDGATAVAGSVGLIQLEQEAGVTINTQSNGEFAFRKLSPGRYRLIGRTERGRAVQEIEIAKDERSDGIVLAIQSGGTIRGMVRGIRAQDLSRLSITVKRPNAGMTLASNPQMDEFGGYVVNGVEEGRMTVTAELAMRRQLSKTIDMPLNGNVTVDFDFPPAARLSGRVTRAGEPLASAMIQPQLNAGDTRRSSLYPTQTNATGEYAIDELAQGEYVITVGSYRSPTVQVSGNTIFDIDVPLAAHYSGRVIESDGEVPIVGATVDVWPTDPASSSIRLHGSSDHLGEFALSGLEPGEFVVTVHKPGYEMHRESVTYGSPITERTIRLRPSRGVNVRILDSRTKAPLRGVRATELRQGSAGLTVPLHPDENGYSQLPSALAGSTIRFDAAGFFAIVIPRWDGSAIQLSLRPEWPDSPGEPDAR